MTSSRTLISRTVAFEILRTWDKNRELLLLETFSSVDKQRRALFVTTTQIEEGQPAIWLTETRSFLDVVIEIQGTEEFFSLPATDKYPVRLLIVRTDRDTAELSEVGKNEKLAQAHPRADFPPNP